MSCVEEIINIEKLLLIIDELTESNQLKRVLDEIILQSKVEFHLFEN